MYTVKSGDNLSRIAQQHGTSLKQVLAANPQFQKNPNLIKPGQQVQIPGSKDSFDTKPAGSGSQRPGGATQPKPQQPGGAAPAPAPAPAGGANPTGRAALQGAADRATAKAGVPASWSKSNALWTLLQHESSLNPRAKNPSSTAYGLFQFLDSTWKGTGVAKTSDPEQQFIGGYRYIKQRYGSPEAAWAFWQKHKWY
ncbi:MAG TPA: LysM peptidoglycan-binding domain-containing protein [Myxococcaceae bacterium]|jgi:LysM repeat protein